MGTKYSIICECSRSRNPNDVIYAKEEIIRSLERTGGNVDKSSHELGMCRRRLDMVIYRLGLRSQLDAIRLKYAEESYDRIVNGPDWLQRTKKVLTK
jgi:hypothetical protein